MVNKIVYNACYGGYSLSIKAADMLFDMLNQEEKDKVKGQYSLPYAIADILPRHDPRLIQVVEELGSEEASGSYATLEIWTTEANTYRIDEYDGYERIETPDEIDWTIIK